MQYVRLADSTELESVIELVARHWRLTEPERPGIVLSVNGSSRSLATLDRRQKAVFNRGLIKSIQTTRGWLMTVGVGGGVAQLVGAAVREGQSLERRGDGRLLRSIHCIGIAPWGNVADREALVNPPGRNHVPHPTILLRCLI